MNEQNTTLAERRLIDCLEAIAATEAPAPSVAVADVIASGRLGRRRRGRSALALCAALVAATGLSYGMVVSFAHDGTAGNATVTTNGESSQPPPVTFGWLPDSSNGDYEVQWSSTGPDYAEPVNPSTNLAPDDGPGSGGVTAWGPGSVFVQASLRAPGVADPAIKFDTPAGTVDGHRAWWVDDVTPGSAKAMSGGQLQLMWQYEPDAWATVLLANEPGTAAAGAMLMTVADNLVIGQTDPRVLPFRFSELPGGLHADAVDLVMPSRTDARYGAASLRLCVTSPCAGASLVIWQHPDGWTGNSSLYDENAHQPIASTAPPVTVGGHPGLLVATSDGATLTFEYDGSSVTIAAAGPEYRAVGGRAGFLAFCDSITWLGTDPAHWTGQYLP